MNRTTRKTPPRRHSAEEMRVAVCIDTRDEPGRERLLGVYRTALERHWLLFLVRGEGPEACRQLAALRLTGAILYDRSARVHRMLEQLGVPSVEASARNLKYSTAGVFADDEKIAGLAAKHLLQAGFEHFGFLGSARSHQSALRCRSFRRHLARQGIPLASLEVSKVEDGLPLESLIRWLRRIPKPAGILTTDDRMGEQVITACQSAGLKVPDEVGVLGVGNDELMCDLAHPRLSSIALPTAKIGQTAAEVLETLMHGSQPALRYCPLPPLEIICRASTDKYPVTDPAVWSAVDFIRSNHHRPIGTSEIAVAIGRARRTLERRFLSATGGTVHDFLVEVRLRQAKRLLRLSDASLSEVARLCGYLAPSAFTRMFTTAAGVHPDIYRQQFRKPGLGRTPEEPVMPTARRKGAQAKMRLETLVASATRRNPRTDRTIRQQHPSNPAGRA